MGDSLGASVRFGSKIDWWLGILLAALPLGGAAALGHAWLVDDMDEIWVALISCAAILVLYVGLVFPLYYEITDTQLVIRFGLARKRVALSEIKQVVPSRNPLSSPALSLDRLNVEYESRWSSGVLISPEPRDAFLTLLGQRAGMTRQGDRLSR